MEKSFFFNSVTVSGVPDRSYTAEDIAERTACLISDGVMSGDSLKVTGCPAAEPAEPDWKVFFGGGFWGGRGNGRAGTELRLETQFDWAGRHWVVPAAYACGKGLVVDVCMRAEADEIRRFLKTWDLSQENDSRDNFTPEQQLQIDLDNPLGMRPDPQLTLNGQPLQHSHGCTVCYNPCLPGSFRSPEAERTLRHYGLDAACGWMLCRFSFLWAGKRRPKIRTLTLTMRQRPCRVPGPHFKVHAPGDSFTFRHPVSGTDYTLQVQELAQETLPRGLLTAFYPTHFTAMRYTLSPAPSEDIRICDCDVGDQPLEIGPCTDAHAPEAQSSAACIGIIGGADGPTAIFVTTRLAPHLLGSIAVAAYCYMALVPVIQPPIMKVLTTEKERQIVMESPRKVSKTEKILFPIIVTIIVSLTLPDAAILVGCLMLGNLMKECGVVERIKKTAGNELMNIITIFLGFSVGCTTNAATFLNIQTVEIIVLGIVAFGVGTAGGVLLGKVMCFVTHGKINPLIGSAGVSAVPMAARVSQKVGQEYNPRNYLLMHAMGPNVAGVIGSAVAAGILINMFG